MSGARPCGGLGGAEGEGATGSRRRAPQQRQSRRVARSKKDGAGDERASEVEGGPNGEHMESVAQHNKAKPKDELQRFEMRLALCLTVILQSVP